jgi:putative transposase
MTQFTPRKSSPRLPTFEYKGAFAYFITINTDDNRPYFREDTAKRCADLLLKAAQDRRFEITAYCVMPNHVHFLASGLDENADLIEFVKRFKQLMGFEFKTATGKQLWQRSFYDHILRSDEDVEGVAAYIWRNPVAAGIVAEATDYPFSGPDNYLGRLSDKAEAMSLRDSDVVRLDGLAGHA